MSRVYFITGCSSGFGKAITEAVLKHGDDAVVTARKLESITAMVKPFGERALPVALDVTDPEQREAAVKEALRRFGRIDVLVNNAGVGSLGALEEFSSEQIRQQMEVNFFGVIEMTRLLLPIMREQRGGHIINLTSIGGLVGVGSFAVYCATKFAVEGFSEALRDEVKPFGIHVTLVEPGAFRTNFAGDANVRPARTIDDYRKVVEPIREYLYGGKGKQPGDPRKAAEAIIRVVENEEPPLRLLLGMDALGLWEKKRVEVEEDVAIWRAIGEATDFESAEAKPIPQA